jgi:hypothetical protein
MATRTITIGVRSVILGSADLDYRDNIFRSNISTTDPALAHQYETTVAFTANQLATAISSVGSREIDTAAKLDDYLKDIQEQMLHDRFGE